jgi:hypothetical protein
MPVLRQADNRYTPLVTFMKFGVTIFVLFLISCVSEEAKDKTALKEVVETPIRPKFHPTDTDELEDTIRTLDLSYVAWSCQCANWILESEHEKYQLSGRLAERTMFIEPADSNLNLPDTIGYTGDVIRYTGQFYEDKGYPKNYPVTEMNPEKARVFRYTKYEILSSGYVNFREKGAVTY